MGEEAEVISQGEQSIPVDFQFPFTVKISQYTAVFTQKAVNIPHKVVCLTVDSVVVVVSALVGTEFLISAAAYNASAIETFFFHSTNVLIKLDKNVLKRLQMTLNNL